MQAIRSYFALDNGGLNWESRITTIYRENYLYYLEEQNQGAWLEEQGWVEFLVWYHLQPQTYYEFSSFSSCPSIFIFI